MVLLIRTVAVLALVVGLEGRAAEPAHRTHGKHQRHPKRTASASQQPRTAAPAESAPSTLLVAEASPAPAPEALLSHEEINTTVVAHMPEIIECVKVQRAEGSAQSGMLLMTWVVQSTGRTTAVAANTAELQNTPLASCLTGLIKDWTFPRNRQAQPISYPFRF